MYESVHCKGSLIAEYDRVGVGVQQYVEWELKYNMKGGVGVSDIQLLPYIAYTYCIVLTKVLI